MVDDLNLNWKFMDKKGLMAHEHISNRTVARKIKIKLIIIIPGLYVLYIIHNTLTKLLKRTQL